MELIKGWNIFRADDAYKSLGDNLLKLATAGSITTNDMIEVIEGNTSPNNGMSWDKPTAIKISGDADSISVNIGNNNCITSYAPAQAEKPEPLSPFKCPCCGGNRYRKQGSVIACEYCDTMFTEDIKNI